MPTALLTLCRCQCLRWRRLVHLRHKAHRLRIVQPCFRTGIANYPFHSNPPRPAIQIKIRPRAANQQNRSASRTSRRMFVCTFGLHRSHPTLRKIDFAARALDQPTNGARGPDAHSQPILLGHPFLTDTEQFEFSKNDRRLVLYVTSQTFILSIRRLESRPMPGHSCFS